MVLFLMSGSGDGGGDGCGRGFWRRRGGVRGVDSSDGGRQKIANLFSDSARQFYDTKLKGR